MMNSLFTSKPRLALKLLLHTTFIIIMSDIIWYILFKGIYFNEDNEQSYYIKRLVGMRVLVLITFLIELFIKILMIIIGMFEYKYRFGLEDAFVIDYLDNMDGKNDGLNNKYNSGKNIPSV